MSALLIVNPAAGRDRASDVFDAVLGRLRDRFGAVEAATTGGPGDAERAASDAARRGVTRIFVAGGDGTLNEALNGAHAAGRLGEIVFGIVPLGTGNDFAAALGVPAGVDAAVDALADAPEVAVDAGRLNDRVFVNISAGGFIGEVSDRVTPEMKSVFGRLAYLVGGARAAVSYDPVQAWVDPVGEAYTMHVREGAVVAGERPASREASIQLFAVCNSRLIGGGHLIAPAALVDDGWLDVWVVEAMPLIDFAALIAGVAAGTPPDDPRVTYLRVRELRLAFARPVLVNTDGEAIETQRCYYKLLPKAVRFLAPQLQYSNTAIQQYSSKQ